MATAKKDDNTNDQEPDRPSPIGTLEQPVHVDVGEIDQVVQVELTGPGESFPRELEETDENVQGTWDAIRMSRLNYQEFLSFVDGIISDPKTDAPSLLTNSEAYAVLKYAVERYVRKRLDIPDQKARTRLIPALSDNVLPYYERVEASLAKFVNDRGHEYKNPAFETRKYGLRTELIWSYWHEEGMLVQSINALALRFQNIGRGPRDPLAGFELDSLRPMANILWGYVQDAQHRLSIERRNYEYQSQYGIRLYGKAAPNSLPVTTRSNFIPAFHNLLQKASVYFRQADDRTIRPDAFPLLNALREVNLILMEGMHNQFNDLSLTARVEMMVEQWILGRREIQDFLRGKPMVIYDEPWMGVVDTMKTVQGWPSPSIKFYHDLAEFGEEILLSIRFTMWSQINDPRVAGVWASRFRAAIQRYIYSYQAVTGVDITAENVYPQSGKYQMPGLLIQQRFMRERPTPRY